ncbi:MAG TPA: hypothetical protein VLA61_06155 [Ideonella sp.]|uniref:hypothetical protein n=1 Tax=Ideonella sp. TaxID=1929293 RepID=UPI002B5C3645|nr:hypothetical protein [Ideonella sp.]HSI47831.1 hypothetical protein [Ideonella sp.]
MYKKLATAAAFAACMGAANAALPPAISLGDAYCDYLTNLTPLSDGGYAGTWANVSCSGTAVQIGGGVSPAYGSQAAGVVMGSQGLATQTLGGHEATVWVTEDGKWRIYNYQGVLMRAGMWTPRTALQSGGHQAVLAD